jgi:glycosyltransferase involved in cell wall biosynthesis
MAQGTRPPVRILYWTAEDLRSSGGQATHVLEVVKHLGLQGHNVLLCTRNDGKASHMQNNPSFGVPTFGPRLVSVLWFEFCALYVIPFLWLRGRADVVYCRFSPATVLLPVVCKLLRIPYVAEFNGLTGQELVMNGHSRLLARVADWVDRFNFRIADRSICVTEGIRRALIAATGRRPEASVVIGNGADGAVFYPLDRELCRAELHLEREPFWIGFVGSLAPWQGVDLLIEAVREVHRNNPDVRAMIVGDGDLRAQLQEAAADCDFITFAGWVPHSLVPIYLGALDVTYFCLREKAGGTSAVKLWEYLAAGRPVIASRADGVSELISEGCCLPFDVERPETLVDAIHGSMQDRLHLLEMGDKGRALVEQDHTWEAVARRTAEVLDALRVASGERTR